MKPLLQFFGVIAASLVLACSAGAAGHVSDRSAASALTGAETIPCIQSGVDCKTTTASIAALSTVGGLTSFTLDHYTGTDLCTAVTGVIAQIAANPVELVLDRTATCPDNATVPSTLSIRIVPGGKITMTTGKLLSITGPFDAPMNQKVFFNATAGQGTVNFKGIGSVAVIYPMWWGAIGDYSTASGPAIRAALVAGKDLYRSGSGGGWAAHVELGSGGYLIDSPGLHIGCFVLFKGQSVGGTTIQTSGTGNDYDMMTADGNVENCVGANNFSLNSSIRDMKFIKTGGTAASNYVYLNKVFQFDIRDVSFSGTTGNGITILESNTVMLDHLEIAADVSTGLTGLKVTASNVTGLNISLENWTTGFNCIWTAVATCQLTLTQPYFERNAGTLGIFDTAYGSTVTGVVVKHGANGLDVVGFSFINGAHHNNFYGGTVGFVGDDGFKPPFKTDATSYMNCFYGTNYQTNLGDPPDSSICFDGIQSKTANYQTTMTPDLFKYQYYRTTFDSGSAWTMAAPLNGSVIGSRKLRFMMRNAFGTMGVATWNSVYKMSSAWVNPANGNCRFIEFEYDATNYIETSRSAADVPCP